MVYQRNHRSDAVQNDDNQRTEITERADPLKCPKEVRKREHSTVKLVAEEGSKPWESRKVGGLERSEQLPWYFGKPKMKGYSRLSDYTAVRSNT